jgi:predicted permease
MMWWRKKRERELQRELESHLELETEERGDPYAARRALGNRALIKEDTRAMWGWTWLERLAQDVRYAIRTMKISPGFTATAVLSLALGIGANTAIFSLIDALMLRWLPVRDPQELVQLTLVSRGQNYAPSLSYPVIRELAAQRDIFSGAFGFTAATLNSGPPEAVESTTGAWVTGDFYETLGLAPVAGRLLTRDDDNPGARPVAVITDGYWARKFGRNPGTVGQTMFVEGVPVTIVGVSPPGFTGTTVGWIADVTMPVGVTPQLLPDGNGRLTNTFRWLRVIARPKPGISLAQAQARLSVAWPRVVEAAVPVSEPYARQMTGSRIDLAPGGTGWTSFRGQFRKPLLVLMTLVGLVLLIACANVANLLLARAASRQREIAVRLAIGAGRARVIRQLLTESGLLAFTGAALGSLLALFGSRFLANMFITGQAAETNLDLTPDLRVLAFTIAIAIGTACLFGLAPAFRATASGPAPALKDVARAASFQGRLAPILVVAQIALSLLLIAGAGLFLRTLENLQNLDAGFRHEGVLLIDFDARRAGYQGARLTSLFQESVQQIERLPGIQSVSLSITTPLNSGVSYSVTFPGQPPHETIANTVSPHYFDTMRTPILLGRDFTPADDVSAPRVVIVNQTFVTRYFPDGHPLGRHMLVQSNPSVDHEVVGVVKDVLTESLRDAPQPTIYVPFLQRGGRAAWIEVYAVGSLAQVSTAVRGVLQPKLPGAPVRIRTLTDQVTASLVKERLMATLAGCFGTLALALAGVGLYGLLAYSVARRTKEIGIRMALGARQARVLRNVMMAAIRLVAIGIALGLPAAWAASTWVKSMLFGLTPTDPATVVGAALVLGGAALLAAYLPARRASRVDPMTALRHE